MKRIIILFFLLIIITSCSNKLEQDLTGITGNAIIEQEPDIKPNAIEEQKAETTVEEQTYIPVEDLIEEDSTCYTSSDCDNYCLFSECQDEKPKYPVLEEVRLYDARTNNQVRKNEDGFYILTNGELYYIIAKADNKRNAFTIIAESDKHFGSKGLNENNRRDFRNKPREAVYTSNDIYEVRISNYESTHEYPFFFNVLASPRDKFDIRFYIEDFKDNTLTTQEFEFPIFIVS
ncbi:hypothetical protein KY335_04330 [Candidatus Woesearchaeota archaeon]|nr:hypothetical protein [Candidatus Woesearchaeota archaeon]